VYGVHALRNALIPLITLFGLMLPDLIGGGVIIETIFAYPAWDGWGMKRSWTRDYNLIMAITVISAGLTVLGNFAADVLYATRTRGSGIGSELGTAHREQRFSVPRPRSPEILC